METSRNKSTSFNRKSEWHITALILSFMIIMFLFFHKHEVWRSLISIEHFAEEHLFLVFFIIAITLIFLYKRKVDMKTDKKKQRITSHYKLKTIRNKVHTQAEKNNINQQQIFYIDKSKINMLNFPDEEVLENFSEVIKRKYEISYAHLLGNKFKHKSRILFKDNYSLKCTETTIWHVDDNHVSLKGGITIPINRIIKIKC